MDEAEAAWVAEISRTRYFVVRGKLFHEQIVGMPRANGSTPSMKRRRGAADERQVVSTPEQIYTNLPER